MQNRLLMLLSCKQEKKHDRRIGRFAPPPACRGRLGGGDAFDLLREERPHPNPPLRAGEGARRQGGLLCSSRCLQGEVGRGDAFDLLREERTYPTLPCEQGREHDARAVALLLPLLAGGGWEGVTLLIFCAKSEPTPSCKHDRRMDRFKTVRTTKDFKIALRARR